jgi:hypothetical protein
MHDVINGPMVLGAVEGGPGTGKSYAAAKAFAARRWDLRKPTKMGKPLTLIVADTNRAAFDLATALYNEGIRIRYACSEQAFFLPPKSEDGAIIRKMRNEGYQFENYWGENEEKVVDIKHYADDEFDVLID